MPRGARPGPRGRAAAGGFAGSGAWDRRRGAGFGPGSGPGPARGRAGAGAQCPHTHCITAAARRPSRPSGQGGELVGHALHADGRAAVRLAVRLCALHELHVGRRVVRRGHADLPVQEHEDVLLQLADLAHQPVPEGLPERLVLAHVLDAHTLVVIVLGREQRRRGDQGAGHVLGEAHGARPAGVTRVEGRRAARAADDALDDDQGHNERPGLEAGTRDLP
mmetsp:Transcript_21482/g.72285  ORF Transcript_21482/g.72285 Transcript_21482/m.72285 type:complete len:221 (-) Transcript_21482:313-975(-)